MAENKEKKGAPEAMETLNRNEAFIVKYKKAIIAGVVVLVLAIIGFISFRSCQNTRQEKASTAMAPLQEQFDQLNQMQFSGEPDSVLMPQYEQLRQQFAKIADEYSSVKAGNLANLYAGLCCASMSKWKETITYLEKFDDCDDQMVSPAALAALGNAYVNTNQLDKAVETLKKAAERANNLTVSPQALINAGQVLESQNKKAEALEVYQKAKSYIDQMDQSVQQGLGRLNIDAYIERLSQK